MSIVDKYQYFEYSDNLHDFVIDNLSSIFERSIAIRIHAAAMYDAQTQTQTKTSNLVHNNKMTLTITQGQVDQYAENYDKIESWMRHYG